MVAMVDGGYAEAWCWEKMALGFDDLIVGWRFLWWPKRGYANSREKGARGTSWNALASD